MNPCGVGIGTDIETAFKHAYDADNQSIFGGSLHSIEQLPKI